MKNIKFLQTILFLTLIMLFLSSCLPERTPYNLDNIETGATNTEDNSLSLPSFPHEQNFFQESSQTYPSEILISSQFEDSFLLRGSEISQYFTNFPDVHNLCLVHKFNDQSMVKFLILLAKKRTHLDLMAKTQEHYLQIMPSDESLNQQCSIDALESQLSLNLTSPSFYFSVSSLCTECSSSMKSSTSRVFTSSGTEETKLNIAHLNLSIFQKNETTNNGCHDDLSCQLQGYSCCLNNACIRDGALRPGATSMTGYQTAKQEVLSDPLKKILYPQFYYLCDQKPTITETTTSSSDESSSQYDAQIRSLELKQIHDCLNPVHEEFSFCTIKFENAHLETSEIFSAQQNGRNDDINFSALNSSLSTSHYVNNIVEIFFDGNFLYQYDPENRQITKSLDPEWGEIVSSTANDSLMTSQEFRLLRKDISKDGSLYITYKVDGTCQKLSTTKIQCSKKYIQGHDDLHSTYYHDQSKTYQLPSYADLSLSQTVNVKINGVIVPESSTTWSRKISTNQIVFSNSYSIYDSQEIVITYRSIDPSIMSSKNIAQAQVNEICQCGETERCNLEKEDDTNSTNAENFKCIHSTLIDETPPTNQTVRLSSRNIPHRFYDENGVQNDELKDGELSQELLNFEYEENNYLSPNNIEQYIGFNEIYGSLEEKSQSSAKRAKMVKVKKGMYYDILVDDFNFNSCLSCGTDYYSSLQKIFPQSFSSYGGGYSPDPYETSKISNSSLYRGDDLLFGRACFLPVTMIPWSHKIGSTVTEQRRNRLTTQHFLFANGYNKDWFGFDYGSVIGSFDGVNWFSIGSRRQIFSKSEKLYLAVNAYVGDLTMPTEFNVRISESTQFSSDIPRYDEETTGAECQKYHLCESDQDCFAQLGYDYSCQEVSSLKTSSPIYDRLSQEQIGSQQKSILSLIGGVKNISKRCVYRGRGAPCSTSDLSFNSSSLEGTLLCSTNNSCLDIDQSYFNDRISRFPYSSQIQNESLPLDEMSDLFGLGARLITRPYDYFGSKAAPQEARTNLKENQVSGLCLPGRSLQSFMLYNPTTRDLHNQHPLSSTQNSADKISGVGVTALNENPQTYYMCPALDDDGKALHFQNVQISSYYYKLISQNLSSKLLDHSLLEGKNLFSEDLISEMSIQRNSCLRAPGSTCFSDFECAPSSFISDRIQYADLSSLLNEAEISFWNESLVCGNPEKEQDYAGNDNEEFKLSANKCCRETEKNFTVYTQTEDSQHKWCDDDFPLIAGVNTSFMDQRRYSRSQIIAGEFSCDINDSSKPYALSTEAQNSDLRWLQIQQQFQTLDKVNEKMCCSTHWVRNFSEDNGGGHIFSSTKMQNIDKSIFKHIQWFPKDQLINGAILADDYPSFECIDDQMTTELCRIKEIEENSDEEKYYLNWLASLELTGIPQVPILKYVSKKVDENQKNPVSLSPLEDSSGQLLSNFNELPDFYEGFTPYFSGENEEGLNLQNNSLKKVFSDKDFSCCLPAGKAYSQSTSTQQCCTGNSLNIGNARICCLPNYTDVSVYLNRYISSEARDLSDEDFDPSTGYIMDKQKAMDLAMEKNLCCSGNYAFGVAISKLPIPLVNGNYVTNDENALVRRFTYINGEIDDNQATGNIGTLYNLGRRWNHHVYCVP